jgi:hypothetical protein
MEIGKNGHLFIAYLGFRFHFRGRVNNFGYENVDDKL